MIYVFDVMGTIVGNVGGLSEDQVYEFMSVLREEYGHEIVLWTSLQREKIPTRFVALASFVAEKPHLPDLPLSEAVFVDDDPRILRMVSRKGAKVIAAQQLAGWVI